MCEYVNIKAGKCNVDNGFCPFLFYCNKNNEYRVNPRMNNTCKKKPEVIHKNYYKVALRITQGELVVFLY